MSSVAHSQITGGGTFRATGNGSGQRILANGEIANLRRKIQISSEMDQDGQMQSGRFATHAWIVFRGVEYVISGFYEMKNGEVLRQQLYLNGEETTSEALPNVGSSALNP